MSTESTKTVKGRISNKHGTEEFWLLSVYKSLDNLSDANKHDNPFTPLPGELIIYDPDSIHGFPRYKFGDPDTREGGRRNIVDLPFVSKGALDEINSIDLSVANEGTYLEEDGVAWDSEFNIRNQDGDEVATGSVYQKIPIVAGRNVVFDHDGSVVTINADGTAITSVESKTDATESAKLYRYIATEEINGETKFVPSHIVEVVEKAGERSSSTIFTPIHTKNNTNIASPESFYSSFDGSLASVLSVTAVTAGGTIYYTNEDGSVLETGIKFGSSKNTGSIVLTPAQDCVLNFIKYYSYTQNTYTKGNYDTNAAISVNGTTYTFDSDDAVLTISLTANTQYTITTHPEGYSGRVILTSLNFGGAAFEQYELARTIDVNNAVAALDTKTTQAIKAIENKIPTVPTIPDVGDIIIKERNYLPTPNASWLKTFVQYDNSLYQCVVSGEGEQKTFSFAVTGTSEITDNKNENGDLTILSEISKDFKNYFNLTAFSKLYRNNDSFKLGSSSAVGTVTFENVCSLPMNTIKIGLRAYNANNSRFRITCGDISTEIAVTDATNEILVTLVPDEENGLYLDETLMISTIESSTDDEGKTTYYDKRGLLTQLLVDFGEVSYSWEVAAGKEVKQLSDIVNGQVEGYWRFFDKAVLKRFIGMTSLRGKFKTPRGSIFDEILITKEDDNTWAISYFMNNQEESYAAYVYMKESGEEIFDWQDSEYQDFYIYSISSGNFEEFMSGIAEKIGPLPLETNSKYVIGAINEINSNTVDKVTSIDCWYEDMTGVSNDGDGISWGNTFNLEINNGERDNTGTIIHKIPLAAGDNIEFEVDEERQVVKINHVPYSQGLAYTLSNDGICYSVTGIGTCTDADIIIPKEYNKLPVTGIGDYAFSSCAFVKSIKLPDSITSIGTQAFANCSILNTIVIPASVTYVGYFALGYCSNVSIYCEASSIPATWNYNWNPHSRPVVWGFANDFVVVNEKINELNEKIDEGGGSDVTVDSELSTTSTNPVQNKVVNAAIEELRSSIGDISAAFAEIVSRNAEVLG